MSRRLRIIAVALSAGLAAACSGERESTPAPASSPAAGAAATPSPTATTAAAQPEKKAGVHAKHKPHPAVIAKAKAPKPPANAKKGNSIGKGKLAAKTDNAAADTDSVWAEEIDIDGDGKVEQTDLLYDDEDKVLYLYAEKEFSCADGVGTGRGGMLMAVNSPGNKRGKPAGSGWYVVELDAGECAARAAALWGCKFNASGNRTECGIAEARVVEDELVIIEPDPGAVAAAPGASPTAAASPRATATVRP